MRTAIATAEPNRPRPGRFGDWIRRWVADHRQPSWEERMADTLEAELARWQAVAR